MRSFPVKQKWTRLWSLAIGIVGLFWLTRAFAAAVGVSVSKANAYAVLGPPTGISVSKANAYAVLGPPPGISVSKANAYAVLGPPVGVSISKAVVYVILAPATQQPHVFITTQNEKACHRSAEPDRL